MSSYFFGGFSAYFIVPSGRQSNQPRMFAQPGMIGRALHGEIDRQFQPVRRRRLAAICAKSVRMSQAPGAMHRGRPRSLPISIRAARILRPPASAYCCAPCGSCGRSGWMGGKYSTSKPMAAYARQDAALRHRTCHAALGSSLMLNAEKPRTSLQTWPASSRSASTGIGALSIAERAARSAARHQLGPRAGDSKMSRRACVIRLVASPASDGQ